MARGPKKHLKRLNAPKHWYLAKTGGTWAPRPTAGPHKLRECLPLLLLLRNRLKYALTAKEVQHILMQRLVKVDNKIRTDSTFPAGFMDVITIEKTNENFRLLYDTKGRFYIQRITPAEAKFKLCRVRSIMSGTKGTTYLHTDDARTFRFPDPLIHPHDTIKVDLETNKIIEHVSFETGNLVYIIGGHNMGRVGVIVSRERHPGSFDIVHIKDAAGQSFSTRMGNVFVIGKQTKSLVSLPKDKGVKKTLLEQYELQTGVKLATH